ncbi:MAG: RagB/SusD family nutrient uptake outer membrane protein [Tannerellaceae bacterium]|jgi:hypothetical protein|nr:RagB/SusD family nutrient uptake outer membrane protein [Tannerellaceae bacterium]
MKNYIISLSLLLSLALCTSCASGFLETYSTQGVDEGNVFKTTESAMTALEGTHKLMYYNGDQSQNYMGYETMLVMGDLMGEDLLFGGSTSLFMQSYNWTVHRTITSAMMNYCYKFHYNIVANVNVIIENIDNAAGSQDERDYIKGQALGLRAAMYFNLVRMWSKRYEAGQANTQLGVPLVLDTETSKTPQPRATVEDVYQAINDDLDQAISLLGSATKRSTKMHLNQSVANGLKSRVALTQGQWEEAARYARAARTTDYALSPTIFTETPSRFCDQSNTEWMWGTKRIKAEDEGFSSLQVFFGNTDAVTSRNGPKCIYNSLYHRISDTDKRKGMFAATAAIANSEAFVPPSPTTKLPAYYNNKYMVPDHSSPQVDCPYMRVSEMYLIEAEAAARLGRDADAQQTLYELIVTRDPQYTKSVQTGPALLDEILLHRRIELWGEGFRFFDLKRMGDPLVRDKPAILPDGKTENSNHNIAWATAATMQIPADDPRWQFLFSDDELNNNPHIIQND